MDKMLVLASFAWCLGSCTATQIEDDSAKVVAGCQVAMQLAPSALALPTVGPFVAVGVLAGCGTAEGIAKLTADPSSAEWLAQQTQILQQALGR